MILPDVSVLVQAFRADTADHERCRRWLEGVLNGESRYGRSPQVLGAVVRVATHPKVFRQASDLDEVLGYGDALLARPNCVVIQPGEMHWTIFARRRREAEARGNLVPDAWFAALAIEAGCQWVTLDRDYARFPGLNWRTPDSGLASR